MGNKSKEGGVFSATSLNEYAQSAWQSDEEEGEKWGFYMWIGCKNLDWVDGLMQVHGTIQLGGLCFS